MVIEKLEKRRRNSYAKKVNHNGQETTGDNNNELTAFAKGFVEMVLSFKEDQRITKFCNCLEMKM